MSLPALRLSAGVVATLLLFLPVAVGAGVSWSAVIASHCEVESAHETCVTSEIADKKRSRRRTQPTRERPVVARAAPLVESPRPRLVARAPLPARIESGRERRHRHSSLLR